MSDESKTADTFAELAAVSYAGMNELQMGNVALMASMYGKATGHYRAAAESLRTLAKAIDRLATDVETEFGSPVEKSN